MTIRQTRLVEKPWTDGQHFLMTKLRFSVHAFIEYYYDSVKWCLFEEFQLADLDTIRKMEG